MAASVPNIRQLFDEESSTYSYLLADDDRKVGLLIDPVANKLNDYLELLDELNLTLLSGIDSHCHADHVTALGALREATGCETLVGVPSLAACASGFFEDGDFIPFGEYKLRCIYTPGHTDDSYCFFLDGPQPSVFSGDTLLINGTGRTDFQNGSAKDLYNSLFNHVLLLPQHTTVYPGHDYNGRVQSTIGQEIDKNPRLQVKSWQELDVIMKSLNLANPKLMDIAIPANQNCGKLFLS
ncbi:MAG: MBL fold metallo-hydrolase [Pseudohongiellaceae bacterium]